MTRILVLDGSAAGDAAHGMAACVVRTGDAYSVVAQTRSAGKQAAEGIGLLAAQVLAQGGWQAGAESQPQLVGVVVGPGSFTGLRASCATAAGYALGVGAALVGVTRGEALRPQLEALVTEAGACDGWMLVTAARRGRVFVETAQGVQAVALADWQPPAGRWLVAGDAAETLPMPDGALLRSDMTTPTAEQIAHAVCARQAGVLSPRDALPLYVDPPEAKLPAAGLRSAPV